MTLEASYPFSADFSGITHLQANGVTTTGTASPSGVAGHLEIERGVMKATLSEDDPVTIVGHRSEIALSPDDRAEYWYCWEFMIPSDWESHGPPLAIAQIHETPDAGDNQRYPNFALFHEYGQLVAQVPTASLPAEASTGLRLGRMNIAYGKWYSACLHCNWQIDGTGFREFFLDRIPLFRQFNVATHYDDVAGPYFKCGVYDFYGNDGYGTKSAYFRNLKIYSGTEGYGTVMGGPPLAPASQLEA